MDDEEVEGFIVRTNRKAINMLADETNSKPDVQESYVSAAGASSLKVEAHRQTHADLVASSGMSPHRTGKALLRLLAEWTARATPPPLPLPTMRDLKREGVPPANLEDEFARRQRQYREWSDQANVERFGKLRNLPTVRGALVQWATTKGWEDPEHIVGAVLRHFVSPICPACSGSGKQMTPGTLGRSVIKKCRECASGEEPGMLKVPHGSKGWSLMRYMEACMRQHASDMRQGAFKLRRSRSNDHTREQQRKHEKAEETARAVAEAEADKHVDQAAVAAHFRIGGKRQHERK